MSRLSQLDLVRLEDLEFPVDLVDLFLLEDLLRHVHLENLEDLVDLFLLMNRFHLWDLFLQLFLTGLFLLSHLVGLELL